MAASFALGRVIILLTSAYRFGRRCA